MRLDEGERFTFAGNVARGKVFLKRQVHEAELIRAAFEEQTYLFAKQVDEFGSQPAGAVGRFTTAIGQ